MKFQQFLLKLLYLRSPLKKGRYEFNIKKGNHSSNGIKTWAIDISSVRFKIKFSDNCNQYVVNNPEQINKAFGLKTGLRGNRNSAMLGYNTTLGKGNKLKFNLFLFVNNDKGQFQSVQIPGEFKTNEWYQFELQLDQWTAYLFNLDGQEWDHVALLNYYGKFDYLGIIRPWFGGKEPNRKGDIKIDIEIM